MIDDPDVDLVDIVVPNDHHAAIAISAAKAGKHIICEKPLGRNAEEEMVMDAILKSAEQGGRVEVE